jgi:hypothetical protein
MGARLTPWLVVVGCSTPSTSPPPPTQMQAALTDAYDEGRVYSDDVDENVALRGIFDEVERHRVSMVAILGDLDASVPPLSICMDTSAVATDRRELVLELQTHLSAVHAQVTVDAARLEVDRHVRATNQLLDEIQTNLDMSTCVTR